MADDGLHTKAFLFAEERAFHGMKKLSLHADVRQGSHKSMMISSPRLSSNPSPTHPLQLDTASQLNSVASSRASVAGSVSPTRSQLSPASPRDTASLLRPVMNAHRAFSGTSQGMSARLAAHQPPPLSTVENLQQNDGSRSTIPSTSKLSAHRNQRRTSGASSVNSSAAGGSSNSKYSSAHVKNVVVSSRRMGSHGTAGRDSYAISQMQRCVCAL